MNQKPLPVPEQELMDAGHGACQGCGAALAMRHVLKGMGEDTTLVIPACCWAVIPGTMPNTCLKVPIVMSVFEAAASVASGVKAGMVARGNDHTNVVAFAGDGGTADIGLQALSGAAERNEDILYICYDNEAYMNTGIQRSGSTPPGAWTTTSLGGLQKETQKKDMPAIMAAHGIGYVATANPSYPEDLVKKVEKAKARKGFRYLHILADCPTGWKHDPADMVKVGRMATQSGAWPLYEVEDGKYTITQKPKRIPIADYLKTQGRFRRFSDEQIAGVQELADRNWERLQAMAGESK